jgi:hypothetical protein
VGIGWQTGVFKKYRSQWFIGGITLEFQTAYSKQGMIVAPLGNEITDQRCKIALG